MGEKSNTISNPHRHESTLMLSKPVDACSNSGLRSTTVKGWWRGGSMEAASLQVDTWGILHWIEMIGRGPQPTFLKSRGILHYSQAYVARALVLLGFAELETGGALVTPFPML